MPDGGGGTTTSTTQTQLSPEQKKMLGLITPVFQRYISPGGEVNASTYPGRTVAPVDPNTIKAENMALGYATGPIADTTKSALAGSSFLTSGKVLDPRTNPYLQSAINASIRPITENYQQVVKGGIRDDAQLAGQYGYNRQGLEDAMAANSYMKNVGDTSASMANAGYQAGLGAMTSALSTEPGVAASGALPAQIVGAVGQQRQALNQQQLDASIADYYKKQFLPLNIASQIAGYAFGMPGGGTYSSGTVPSQNNTLNNLIGLGSLGLGAAALFA